MSLRSSVSEKAFYLIYNILVLLFSPLILGGVFLRYPRTFLSDFWTGMGERLGRVRLEKDTTSIWVHAASLGECRAALPFIRRFRREFPSVYLYFSCTTLSGIEEARRLNLGDRVFLAPIDLPWIAGRLLRRMRPRALVLLESELWPNWLARAQKASVPVVVINGRISKRSAARYQKAKFFANLLMSKLDFVCAREEQDAKHFLQIGLPPEKLRVAGNLKFDLDLSEIFDDKNPLWQNLRRADPLVWTAGSVRKGEENFIYDVFFNLRKTFPELKLIFAPRHLDLLAAQEKELSSRGLKVILRSKLEREFPARWDVLLWDTFGNLYEAYAVASVVFVGGSLVSTGGQNPIEPAWFARPVFFGPHMDNFAQASQLLLDHGGAIQVNDSAGLQVQLARFLQDPALRQAAGEKAQSAVRGAIGQASSAALEVLRRYLA